MKANPSSGFSLIELLVSIGILSVALVVMATTGMFMTQMLSNKELVFLRAHQLEARLLESLQDPANFSFELRNRMRDGAKLPAFEINFSSTVGLVDLSIADSKTTVVKTTFKIPESTLQFSELKPSVSHYDADGTLCAAASSDCPISLELSLIQVAGPYDQYTNGGVMDWLELNGRKDSSTIPVYGLAYRFKVLHPQTDTLISIGGRGDKTGKFVFEDYASVIPGDVYLEVNGSWSCPPGSLVRGIDPYYQSPICLKMGATCARGEIGKQLQISGNTLIVDCVPFRKYQCSDDAYVVSWISPKFLDSDYSGSEKPGECVYKGVRTQAITIDDSNRAEQRCGSKYNMTTSCDTEVKILSMCVSPPDPDTGAVSTVAPDAGSVSADGATTGTNSYACQLKRTPASSLCPAGYSGGAVDVRVKINTSCTIRPGEEFRPLAGME